MTTYEETRRLAAQLVDTAVTAAYREGLTAALDEINRRRGKGDDEGIAARRARNIAEAPAAAAIVRAHLDRIAQTDQERGYVERVIVAGMTEGSTTLLDWASRLKRPQHWDGIQVSPAVLLDRATCDGLSHPPTLTMQNDVLYLRLGGEVGEGLRDTIEERIFNAPEQVYEVVRLPFHRLVCISTGDEVFILTEAEFASQV